VAKEKARGGIAVPTGRAAPPLVTGAARIGYACDFCRNRPAAHGRLCDECGGELFEQWKADRDVAAHDGPGR